MLRAPLVLAALVLVLAAPAPPAAAAHDALLATWTAVDGSCRLVAEVYHLGPLSVDPGAVRLRFWVEGISLDAEEPDVDYRCGPYTAHVYCAPTGSLESGYHCVFNRRDGHAISLDGVGPAREDAPPLETHASGLTYLGWRLDAVATVVR